MSSPPPAILPPGGTVIPFPLPWGQTGCCPPGGMDALMKCYCDIQAASAFIGQIMIDQINNNPDVTAAIIAAIEKSGSNLPLVGVTNGVDAQPGQVGEYILFVTPTSFPTGDNTQVVTAGTLPPGDWDCYLFLGPSEPLDLLAVSLSPMPAGFTAPLFAIGSNVTPAYIAIAGNETRALTSVPSLIAWHMQTTATAAGTCNIWFQARRRR